MNSKFYNPVPFFNMLSCNDLFDRKFFRSKNFEGWFQQRQEEVNCKLSALHLEALCEANIAEWAKDKQEVEVVDLLLKLREKMVRTTSLDLTVHL